ncbi:MAG: integrase core domain-containing protein [Psychroserpens sp.]|uniref:integrase core domain-containing protein n=1 Tax=Psychroserpens sp. TaxID=2020870 RepID=UPI003001FB2F
MYKNDKVIGRYSEPFKLKILAELSTGKYTKSELGKLYNIAPTTINEWIRKYERKDLMNTRVKVETKNEITRIKALQKDIKQVIHHSDRGIQYCSNQYTQILKRKKIRISMTEENHCYENGMAERVNGILKDEFYLDQTFTNVTHAKRAAKNEINLYNEIRLHLSLDYKTPNMVYKLTA